MQREKLNLSESDGYKALQGHLVDKAKLARERYGPELDLPAFQRMLDDRDVVRHPTTIRFDSSRLYDGEFGMALPVAESSPRSYELILHEQFEGRGADCVMLAAYHIPTINYLDIVTHEEAELFGSTLVGMENEAYYDRVCSLADELK